MSEEKQKNIELLNLISDPRRFETLIHYFDTISNYSKDKTIQTEEIYAIEDLDSSNKISKKKLEKLFENLPYLKKIFNNDKHFFNKVIHRFVHKYKGKVYHPKGLYSEQIFGPINNYECQCGYYQGEVYKDKVCPICNVRVSDDTNRYQSIAYIELKLPLINPLVKHLMKRIVKMTDFQKITHGDRNTTQYFQYFMLFNKRTQKFEIPKEIPFQYLPKYMINATEIYQNPVESINKIIEYCIHADLISNKDLETFNKTYDKRYVVLGQYSLIKNIFSEELFPIFLNKLYDILTKYPQLLRYMFMLIIPVTTPESRPIVQLEKQIIFPQISRILQTLVISNKLFNYIEHDYNKYIQNPLKYLYEYFNNLVETPNEILEKEITISKLQDTLEQYYQMIIEDELRGKEGKIRQELLGKTIDFTSRNVITPTLKIKPYEIMISYHTAKKVLLPEFINMLYILSKVIFQKINPTEINPELYKSQIKLPKENQDEYKRLLKQLYSETGIKITETKYITYVDLIQILLIYIMVFKNMNY